MTIKVVWRKSQCMISGKLLAQQLEKFLKSPVCQDARVMVKLPHGEYRSPDGHFDILSVSLMENNVLGQRETHRIVIRLNKEIASPGEIETKL